MSPVAVYSLSTVAVSLICLITMTTPKNTKSAKRKCADKRAELTESLARGKGCNKKAKNEAPKKRAKKKENHPPANNNGMPGVILEHPAGLESSSRGNETHSLRRSVSG